MFGYIARGFQKADKTTGKTLADFSALDIDGNAVELKNYVGKNYKELVEVYDKYNSQGFEVLAFPCNQFGGQEPAPEAEVKAFAQGFGVKFPMFSKIDVNGNNVHPLYNWLKTEKRGTMGDDIKWNFAKFLVGKDGLPHERYAPPPSPLSIVPDIEKHLSK
ncbi:hypothetical protein CYMTET_47495 [Cymbomonas tetramitiformis]|uniref:Glutathione peroxidase n=1 Tax=Cymbomonas tetramitiformis TaxID=36881 RepID=A0AAE0BVM0_9CHLO|nr:hypothetical protein CYMTET_47495 [Cymbomonas tetramitiformis]